MYRLLWISLLAIALLVLALGCPRKQPTTNAITPPPASTPADQNTPATPPATDTATPPADAASTATDATGTPTDTAVPPATDATTPPTDTATPPATPPAEAPKGVYKVKLETTKGNIVLEVHPEWSPLGAAHFAELVNAKFYDGAPWFRVIKDFVAQCGIAADPALNTQWAGQTIQDEPVVQGNKPGFVAFGTSGPNSRSTHFFINFADNSAGLDGQGFSCFAKVIEGMDVALKLYKAEFQNQQALAMPGGMEAFKKMYPEADYIKKATIVK